MLMRRRYGIALLLAPLAWARTARSQAYAEGPEARAWFVRALQLAGFTTGAGERPVAAVVFFDAQCPHCARLWQDWRALRSSLRVHWVPVVLLAPASARQGAALLRAADPAAAMDELAAARLAGADERYADQEPDAEEAAVLRRSTAHLRAMQVAAVPAVLHRERSGRIGLTVGALPAARLAEFAVS